MIAQTTSNTSATTTTLIHLTAHHFELHSAAGLSNLGQIADSVAGILDLSVEVLHLVISALELGAPEAKLVALGAIRHGL